MSSHFFDSFADALAFAKQVATNNKKHTIKREGVRFVVEVHSVQNTFQENKFERVDAPHLNACVSSESNKFGAANQAEKASKQREAESAIRQQQAQATLKKWQDESNAKAKAKRRQAKATSEQRRVIPPVNEQDEIRKNDKLDRAIRFIKKLDKSEQSRKISRRGTGVGSAGGWTSLKQGERKVGDNATKQYISEGIAGTRAANKKMRGRGG